MSKVNPRQHAKSEALVAYREQCNRAYKAGCSQWISGANIPNLSTAAIVLLTAKLKAKLDNRETAAVRE